MKTLNPNIWPYLWRLIIAVGVIAVICMALPGCSQTKQLEKAKQKVLTNKEAFNEVGRKFVDLNPCVNDSSTTYKAGGIDSALLQEYYDWINGKFYDRDSLGISDLVYRPERDGEVKTIPLPHTDNVSQILTSPDEIQKAFTAGYKQGVKDFIAKHPPRLPDTVKTSVLDKQKIKLLEEELAKEREKNARLQGLIDSQKETIKTLHQKVVGWIWWLVAACSVGVAGIVAAVFIRRKKLPL